MGASKVATKTKVKKAKREERDPREKVKLTNPKLKSSSRCLKKALIWKKAKKEERDPTVKVVMTKKAVNAEDPEDKEVTASKVATKKERDPRDPREKVKLTKWKPD